MKKNFLGFEKPVPALRYHITIFRNWGEGRGGGGADRAFGNFGFLCGNWSGGGMRTGGGGKCDAMNFWFLHFYWLKLTIHGREISWIESLVCIGLISNYVYHLNDVLMLRESRGSYSSFFSEKCYDLFDYTCSQLILDRCINSQLLYAL